MAVKLPHPRAWRLRFHRFTFLTPGVVRPRSSVERSNLSLVDDDVDIQNVADFNEYSGFMYEFMREFAPHLSKDVIDQAVRCHNKDELESLFAHIDLPVR